MATERQNSRLTVKFVAEPSHDGGADDVQTCARPGNDLPANGLASAVPHVRNGEIVEQRLLT
jgi:hypothetical protein